MTIPKPSRRRFQYSLRTLLVFVTLFAILCSWFAVKMQQANRQWAAAEEIIRLGGTAWGEDDFFSFFQPVHSVGWAPQGIVADELRHLVALPQLQRLELRETRSQTPR